MGGDAFRHAVSKGQPTIFTPRMSPAEYQLLKQTYITRLQDIFPEAQITTLLEAPGKLSHGDIDIRVSLPSTIDLHAIDFANLATQLGATAIIPLRSTNRHNCTIAVPVDTTRSTHPALIYRPAKPQLAPPPPPPEDAVRHAQIDIDIFHPSPQTEWQAFISSYGDTAPIFNRLVRPYGFLANSKGFAVRARELDEAKAVFPDGLNIGDAAGVFELSCVPAEVMSFVGLDVGRWEAGYETEEELFEWWVGARLVDGDVLRERWGNDGSQSRKGLVRREMYTRFFGEWLPRRLGWDKSDGVGGRGRDGEDFDEWLRRREVALREAIEHFDKREEYELFRRDLVGTIRKRIGGIKVKELISTQVEGSDKQKLEVMRALRRWTDVEEGDLKLISKEHGDEESNLGKLLADDAFALREPDRIATWVKDQWDGLIELVRRPPPKESQV